MNVEAEWQSNQFSLRHIEKDTIGVVVCMLEWDSSQAGQFRNANAEFTCGKFTTFNFHSSERADCNGVVYVEGFPIVFKVNEDIQLRKGGRDDQEVGTSYWEL